MPDFAERNMPSFQQRQLIFREIFVQEVQAKTGLEFFRTGRRAAEPCRSSKASCASRTASAMAERGMRPPQRLLQMKSHDRPSATSSKTCPTMMCVPLKEGLLWQISGPEHNIWPRLNSFRQLFAVFMVSILKAHGMKKSKLAD